MKNDFAKLNFRRGASIMIALIIFLLCALAGVSAFLMAATNVGRYAHTEEQEYYSVSSAALMVVDMLDGLKYESGKITYVYERFWEYVNGSQRTASDKYTLTIPAERGNWSKDSGAGTLRGSHLQLCSTILSRCNELIPYFVPGEWYDGVKNNEGLDVPRKPDKDLAPVEFNFTVTVPDDNRFGTVKCKLVMNTSYDLNLTFSGENGEYAISVYWQATLSQTKTTGNPIYDYTTPTGEQYTKGHLTQTDELTITAKWKKDNVTISRGAVQ